MTSVFQTALLIILLSNSDTNNQPPQPECYDSNICFIEQLGSSTTLSKIFNDQTCSIEIKISDFSEKAWSYALYNTAELKLQAAEVDTEKGYVSLSDYPEGEYILKLHDMQEHEIDSYRIIKC